MNQMRPLSYPDVPRHTAADLWIAQLFNAKSATRGAIVRRSVRSVEREVGRDRLIAEVQSRGWHMVENGGQFVILCNDGGVRIVC